MNKKIIVAVLISLFTVSGIFAQQITKFGVVDTNKVYNAYFRNSTAIRNYEKKRADYQNEINKTTEELRDLRQKKDYLTEYTNAKNVELDSLAKSLKNSDEFYKKLYSTLSKLAEEGGYSMILSLQESNSILWYSHTVDITEDVISRLGL